MIKSFVLFCIKLVRFYWHQPNIKRSLENLNISNAFDVGAHKGQTVNYLLDLKNIKKIYSFEPQDIPFKYLKKKYQNNKKVILNKMALSNIRKKKIFYINEFSETSTFSKINKNSTWLKIKNKILDKKDSILDTVVIITSTLDTYVKKNKIKKIDLLKIDTEGHELDILKGSINTIKKNKIKYILIELHTSKMYKNYSKEKIEKFLNKNNFVLLKKFKFPLHTFVDSLYKHKKIKAKN